MCLSTPSTPAVEKYKESAQAQTPDNSSVATAASRRTTDRVRGNTPTILTSGLGDQNAGSTETAKKMLLGA